MDSRTSSLDILESMFELYILFLQTGNFLVITRQGFSFSKGK